MKFKFKITKKELIIFSVFCVFLLYFSAIAVLNVLTLINDGTFYGLNPIEGFTIKYLPGTLMVFLSVLIAVFLSTTDSIFQKDDGSGFGLTIGDKEEKGYSRWLKEKELKKSGYKVFKVGVKDPDADHAGVVFINDGKNMWVDDGEFHTLVIGVTGAGKTSAVVDPLIYSLCKHNESMVITDPKGEIYRDHSELLRARGYNIVVLNFRDPQFGNAWNPLAQPFRLYQEGKNDKAIELLNDVADNIMKEKNPQDPFWQNSASDYFSACALGLFQDAKEEEVNITSINYMTTVGEEKFKPGAEYIKEYFTMKGEQSSAYMFANNTINSPGDTKGSILSVFRSKIRIFSTQENLSEMLAYSDFDMRMIGKEKTALFMVIHDEKTTYHALATIFIKQCYETLIDTAQNETGGKLPFRTNFILDEFANMPALKDVTTMVTAARSRQIRFTFIIQNFAQLNDVYGQEDAQTIRSNCGNLIYLLTTELAALEEISKLCGEVKSKKDDKTESHPLVTVAELQKLKMNEVIIIRNRQHPFRTKLKQAFAIDWGDSEYSKDARFIEREKKEIQCFQIKEFVDLRSKSKKNAGPSGAGANPFGAGMNPFAGGANPFASGGNPFGDGPTNPFGGPNPFAGNSPQKPKQTFKEFMESKNGTKPKKPEFNMDDFIKKLDAKIAELEEQERQEEALKNGEKVEPIKTEKENVSPIAERVVEPKPTITKEVGKEAVELSSKPKFDIHKETNTVQTNETGFIKEIKIPVDDTQALEKNRTNVNSFNDLMKKKNAVDLDKTEVLDLAGIKAAQDGVNLANEKNDKLDVSDDAFLDDFFDE